MIRAVVIAGQVSLTTVGFASSVTYVVQSWSQIRRHGFAHWVEAGFERIEDVVDEVEEEVA